MLVLTRKEGQSIVLGDGKIVIYVSQIKGKQVRIGVDAPPNIEIHRQEVFDEIKASEIYFEDKGEI